MSWSIKSSLSSEKNYVGEEQRIRKMPFGDDARRSEGEGDED